MEAKIQKYLYRLFKIVRTNHLMVMNCKHEWREEGDGYICKKCDFYTGINWELNKLIEKLLDTKPKGSISKKTAFKARFIFSKPKPKI